MILDDSVIDQFLDLLTGPNNTFDNLYPGRPKGRKAVHTVYGGAQLFVADRAQKIGTSALESFHTYAANFAEFAKILEIEGYDKLPDNTDDLEKLEIELGSAAGRNHYAWLAYTVYNRVESKLKEEAVEDFRIDFEDGFGKRTDREEDHYAEFAAKELLKGMRENILPPFIGIRIKPLTEQLKYRSIRTLNIFMTTLLEGSDNTVPENFVITLPKVTKSEEVQVLCSILDQIEEIRGIDPNTLKIEIMVETTQSLISHSGRTALPLLIEPGRERIVGAHFGVYDYTASNNIIAKYQEMDHIACDIARHMMKISLSGTGIRLSDGATNILPVAPNRGENLTSTQLQENRNVVHRAWKKGFDHTIHSLKNGYYQGWDLHPAQLPIRYAAVYSFFLANLDTSIRRLNSFVTRAAKATLTGDVFDDAATALALLNYFNLALEAKAITEGEAKETGLTIDEIYSQSFDVIMANRSD